MTSQQFMLSGSADPEDATIAIRNRLRQPVRDDTAAWVNVTLGNLLNTWLAGHPSLPPSWLP